MILYIGKSQSSFIVKKIAQKKEEEVIVHDTIYELDTQIDDIIRYAIKTIVIDMDPLTAAPSEIVEATEKIRQALDAKIIIFAKGYNPGSELIQSFYNYGYTDFVISNLNTIIMEEFEKCLDGYFQKSGAMEPIVAAAEAKKQNDDALKKEKEKTLNTIKEAQRKRISIGVAGSKSYIGTTTQTVQIAKYYIHNGKTAAIVEVNSTGYFRQWMDFLKDDSKEKFSYNQGLDLFQYKDLDIYLNPEQVTKLIKQKYDCIIYDYGTYGTPEFEKLSYYDKDITCLVCGNKVNEYFQTLQALQENSERENMYYLFSFISKDDQKDILKSMTTLADRTLFPAYSPDMFAFNVDNNYEKFFKFKIQQEKKKNKQGLFSFFKK